MDAYSRAAYVLKPKSLNGWVVCHAADGFPFALEEGTEVHFVPPSLRGPRQAKVAELRVLRDGVWEARFEGIDSVEDAQAISGCICLVRAQDSPGQVAVASPSTNQMVGCTLIEATAGEVGPIVAVQPGPAHDWLVVQRGTEEILVPAVDAFLGPIDVATQTIHATLPAGLLDLGQQSVSSQGKEDA